MNYKENKNIHVMEHPLIGHKLAILRDVGTGTREFRQVVEEITSLMTYEATWHLPTKEVEVTTPLGNCKCNVLAGKKLAIVAILRGGLGMVDGVLNLLPSAKIGHVGMYRDPETMDPVEYYCKMPTDIAEREVIIVDPMLATGGTASASIQFMKDYECKKIKLMNLLATPEGLERVAQEHPDVELYVAGVDPDMNEDGFIVPGLGDAGDRIFGTK